MGWFSPVTTPLFIYYLYLYIVNISTISCKTKVGWGEIFANFILPIDRPRVPAGFPFVRNRGRCTGILLFPSVTIVKKLCDNGA